MYAAYLGGENGIGIAAFLLADLKKQIHRARWNILRVCGRRARFEFQQMQHAQFGIAQTGVGRI